MTYSWRQDCKNKERFLNKYAWSLPEITLTGLSPLNPLNKGTAYPILYTTTKLSMPIFAKTKSGIHTNLDELSFFTVFALPNASRIGFACSNCCSSSPYAQWNIIIVLNTLYLMLYSSSFTSQLCITTTVDQLTSNTGHNTHISTNTNSDKEQRGKTDITSQVVGNMQEMCTKHLLH